MSQFWLAEFGFGLLIALVGGLGGWWLRGRSSPPSRRLPPAERQPDRKLLAGQALESLHAAAETVRSCVQQHIDCIQAIRAELNTTSATEPAIITNAAQSIIAANGLVQHQLGDVQRVLDVKQEEIKDCLAQSDGLFFTFASLDRQKHVYRQVLSSLELLAADLAGDVTGHERRLQTITNDITSDGPQSTAGVNNAISQILDATADLERRVESTEKKIDGQAESVNMQAILSHTDLLTSLPNRRAFEAELERVAARTHGRGAVNTIFLIDLDHFRRVNGQYGHQGGDLILHQAAAMIKQIVRGKDAVCRYSGDAFAVLVSESTVHDALPAAERIRHEIAAAQFSHGNHPLHVTVSIGIAQLRPEELSATAVGRAEEAMRAARQAGGNLCFRHDGKECFPVSAVFQARDAAQAASQTLASMWRESTEAEPTHGASRPAGNEPESVVLCGRSLFIANLSRRMSEWKRGGPAVSVAIVRVDQIDELVARFGPPARGFIQQVLSRLLEAATREMDERCEFEDGVFAVLLPGIDEANALAVAERLGSQVRQCKVRIGANLWDLTASVGVVHSTIAFRVMDLMLSAEAAMKQASKQGGDAVCVGLPVQEESQGAGG
ncbi:MAG: diguanylate cyclase [Pirellulales bacterium]